MGRPSFMSPTNSSVAKSPRGAYPSHAVTTNGSTLVQHDRWPAAASTTESSTKVSQKCEAALAPRSLPQPAHLSLLALATG